MASRHDVKAPAADGAVVADPPLAAVGRLLDRNRARGAASGLPDVLGRPWLDLRHQARLALLQAAETYHQAAGEPFPKGDPATVVMAGHQPELFHPGVWVKNFALSGLARTHGATAVNLVVDNDVCRSALLRYPETGAAPRVATVPFDRGREAPWEERIVEDEGLFASLAERFRPDWPYEPLLPTFWAEATRQAQRTPLLGERFAAARRTFERLWGCHNVEVPVSAVCATEPYAWFAVDLLTRLPRFREAYNGAVQAYRRRHGLRSKNHPVPDLTADSDWLEAPFWAWRVGQARRGRLFARRTADALELRGGGEAWPTLPLGRPETTVAAWLDLGRRGYKVRSRALTNTLFARLFLCDLFLHGIGGGKYDEVTDDLMRRFYAVEPPDYLVLSATLRLPLPRFPEAAAEARRLRTWARDLVWNPQRHGADGAMAERKRALIGAEPTDHSGRRRWFEGLRRVTEELRPAVAPLLAEVDRRRREAEHHALADAVLRRRDYAFCLYPEAELRALASSFSLAGASDH